MRRVLVERSIPGSLSLVTSTVATWHDRVASGAMEVVGVLHGMVDAGPNRQGSGRW